MNKTITYISPFDSDLIIPHIEMSQDKLEEIEEKARSLVESVGFYQHRSVRIEKRSEDLYRVLVSNKTREHNPGIRGALRIFLHYCNRRCTSCGLMGCGHDLNPNRSSILDIVGI